MPQINRIDFRYDPISGDLLIDSFRSMFYTERFADIQDTLQYLTFVFDEMHEIEGEILFTDTDGEPPEIRDLRYASPETRVDKGDPFPDTSVTLWP